MRGAITSPDAIKAMKAVDRKLFVPQNQEMRAYEDTPLPIGAGQTISAPHMHASALEALLPAIPDPDGSYSLLDIGCGSGYFTALLATARPNAKVYGIDCFPGLLDQTKNHCNAVGQAAANVEISLADGWKGLPHAAPFEVIHCGAGATSIPSPLLAQLRLNGRMVLPVGQHGMQTYLQIDRIRQDPEPIGGKARASNRWNGDGLSQSKPNVQPFSPINQHSAYNGDNARDVDLSCFRIEEKAVVAFVPLIPNPRNVISANAGKRDDSTIYTKRDVNEATQKMTAGAQPEL